MVSANNGKAPSNGLLVVVSQGQSRNPEKRELEETIATIAAGLPNTTSMVVPNLYDLAADSQSVDKMRNWSGPIVILSWLFDRAAFWVLDRNEIRGQLAEVLLLNPDLLNDDDSLRAVAGLVGIERVAVDCGELGHGWAPWWLRCACG